MINFFNFSLSAANNYDVQIEHAFEGISGTTRLVWSSPRRSDLTGEIESLF